MTTIQQLTEDTLGLGKWSILSAYRGSIAHGMYRPKNLPDSIDDKDVISVCVPPASYYFGLDQYASRGTQEVKQDEWDVVIYELRKFVGLLYKGNPNVLSLLWTPDQFFIKRTLPGNMLLNNRSIFSVRNVYHSFVGYAHGQLHRMTNMAFEGYMGEKRKELVTRYGYDCKNAAHLIRLLRMGTEFLNTGELIVLRPDNNELLGIKNGEWRLEQVQAEAEHQFKRAEAAYDRSTLPLKPDYEAVNALCAKIVQTQLTLM